MYAPILSADAFMPLPRGITLEGSAVSFRVMTQEELQEQNSPYDEVILRVLVALAMHGTWAAIKLSAIYDKVEEEHKALLDNKTGLYVPHSQILTADHPAQVLEAALNDLIGGRFLHYLALSETEQYIYPSQELIDSVAGYR